LPDAVRASNPPRRIVARLPRVALFAAGATATAMAAVSCSDGEMAVGLYGGACPPDACDFVPEDASRAADVTVNGLDAGGDASDTFDAVDAWETEESSPMVDAIYGGPPLDSGSDADDGD
jgi:hypothetical protein